MYVSKTPGNGFLRCQLCGGMCLEKRAVKRCRGMVTVQHHRSAMWPHTYVVIDMVQTVVPEDVNLSRGLLGKPCTASHYCGFQMSSHWDVLRDEDRQKVESIASISKTAREHNFTALEGQSGSSTAVHPQDEASCSSG